MKNIHILPTDKPSRLHLGNSGLVLFDLYFNPKIINSQHIYITSDEEIKDLRPHKGKWQLEKGQILNKFPNYLTDLSECKLVILTTDQDLIKDGVQAIDDEFLEWFVKNPSCEEIKIESLNIGNGKLGYIICKPKQESLEEATERLSKNAYKKHSVKDDKLSLDEQIQRSGGFIVGFKEGMIEGAKWQAERSYSEEEVIVLLQKYRYDLSSGKTANIGDTTKVWFEQFKKK